MANTERRAAKKKIEIDPELLIKITNVKTQSNTMLHER